jgi:ubiquinol-cytochrome c reductase cytochrome b subunit
VTPAHIVPEWYFLPFYAILRAIDFNMLFIDSKLGGVIFFAGSILILFLVPWLDTSKVRSGSFRPVFRWFYWLFVANFVMLAYLGAAAADGVVLGLPVPTFSKICTFYYFAYFLVVLPVLGRIETTRPLPASISEAVLAKPAAKPAA